MRRLYRVIVFAYYYYREQHDAFEVSARGGGAAGRDRRTWKQPPQRRIAVQALTVARVTRRHARVHRAQEKYHWHQRFERFCELNGFALDPLITPTA